MYITYMSKQRKIFISFFIWIFWVEAYAQFKPLVYDNINLPSAIAVQPQWQGEGNFFGIPWVADQQWMIRFSGFTPYDLLADNGVNFNQKWQNVLNSLSVQNGAFGHSYQQLFYYTTRFNEVRWSGGISHQTKAYAFYPVSFLKFALYGNKNYTGPVNANEINFSLTSYYTFWLGMNKPVNAKTRIGWNLKIYNAQLHASSQYNRGKVYTVPGQKNYYQHRFENIKVRFVSAGFKRLPSSFEGKETPGALIKQAFKTYYGITGNWGLGFDWGMQRKINEKWQLDFSVSDVGFIMYADDVVKASAKGNYTYEGVEIVFPENPVDYWEEIKQDLKEKMPYQYSTRGVFFKMNEFQIYSSFKYFYSQSKKKKYYSCWNPLTSTYESREPYAGMIFFYQYLHPKPYWGTAVYGQFYPTRWLTLRTSYSFDRFTGNNLGLWTQISLGRFRLYLILDNLISLNNLAFSQGHQLGWGMYWNF